MTRLFEAQLTELRSSIENGSVPAAAVGRFGKSTGVEVEVLMLVLISDAQKFAVPPISNFRVGTVALGTSGNLYFGANFEFPGESLSMTVHGEQAAVTHAIARGERGIELLAISAAPCGFCRQFLNELTTADDLRIALPGKPVTTLRHLLPDAFGPKDLGVAAALMAPQSHGLVLASGKGDPVIGAALDAANRSYAPYTSSFAGVALKTTDGAIHAGSLAENAAFNPSLSPVEAAAVALVIPGGKSYGDIVDAALVEVEGARASQVDVSRAVLRTMTGVTLRIAYARPA